MKARLFVVNIMLGTVLVVMAILLFEKGSYAAAIFSLLTGIISGYAASRLIED